MVEKGELLGLDYLWEVCLHIRDETIADSAIQLLLNMSYNNLNPRLKKVRALSVARLCHVPAKLSCVFSRPTDY